MELLTYQENGCLAPGIHELDWESFLIEFGYNAHRLNLITGLEMAISDLKKVGGKKIFVDGSFVTKKIIPEDYDACWEEDGVDLNKLKNDHPLFFDFSNKRANQKAFYKGELMPAGALAKLNPVMMYKDFFQLDREDNVKGIICLNI